MATPPRFEHVVVIGASMAGLLAARAVADHAERVTVVERDGLGDDEAGRQGVPQGRHLHALLARGDEILEQFFPGLAAELVAAGAARLDTPGDIRWYQEGGHKVRQPTGIPIVFVGRPLLETRVRRRLARLANVEILGGREVPGLITSASRDCVTGVRVRSGRDSRAEESTLAADLVIDATGRGSRAPRWLSDLGFEPPVESEVRVDLAYTTRHYRRRDELLPDARGILTPPAPPTNRRAGGLFPIEGEQWIVTLAGCLGERAPTHDRGFLEFARGLACSDLYDVLRQAEPISEFATHLLPSSRRRHFEKLRRFPQGFVVLGDAVCSFNPIYGQGISVSALQAEALRGVLAEAAAPAALARRYFRRASRAVDAAWTLAAGTDFRFPEVTGPRPWSTGLVNRYVSRLHRASFTDATTTRAFFEVMTLTRRPESLFRPAVAWRVLTRGARG